MQENPRNSLSLAGALVFIGRAEDMDDAMAQIAETRAAYIARERVREWEHKKRVERNFQRKYGKPEKYFRWQLVNKRRRGEYYHRVKTIAALLERAGVRSYTKGKSFYDPFKKAIRRVYRKDVSSRTQARLCVHVRGILAEKERAIRGVEFDPVKKLFTIRPRFVFLSYSQDFTTTRVRECDPKKDFRKKSYDTIPDGIVDNSRRKRRGKVPEKDLKPKKNKKVATGNGGKLVFPLFPSRNVAKNREYRQARKIADAIRAAHETRGRLRWIQTAKIGGMIHACAKFALKNGISAEESAAAWLEIVEFDFAVKKPREIRAAFEKKIQKYAAKIAAQERYAALVSEIYVQNKNDYDKRRKTPLQNVPGVSKSGNAMLAGMRGEGRKNCDSCKTSRKPASFRRKGTQEGESAPFTQKRARKNPQRVALRSMCGDV